MLNKFKLEYNISFTNYECMKVKHLLNTIQEIYSSEELMDNLSELYPDFWDFLQNVETINNDDIINEDNMHNYF